LPSVTERFITYPYCMFHKGVRPMSKTALGPQALFIPLPTTLVGAIVNDKPTFTTVAYCGIASSQPPTFAVSLRHTRHTLKGIRKDLTFSVNIPSADMAREADYCGIVSGSDHDKVDDCQFKIFYGKLGNAPLIEQCPVNLECKVWHILDLGNNAYVIGSIEETHISSDCLTDGKPDCGKINAIAYVANPIPHYRSLGDIVANAFSIGKELKKE